MLGEDIPITLAAEMPPFIFLSCGGGRGWYG